MRIIAGTYRSRMLKSLTGDITRPTTDKVKEAIFSRIGPYFDGGDMLDLFAGSGNMGCEAISRGMNHVVFCDHQGAAQQIIKENIHMLGVEQQCTCWKMDFHRALEECATNKRKFDLIYLDPPYKQQQIDYILTFIQHHELCKPSGIIVCESLKEDNFQEGYGDIIKEKETTYGITRITYYNRRKENDKSIISGNL